MLRRIENYTTKDIADSISYLLDKATESEEVRALAVNIVANKSDSVAAIYDWVKNNVQYVPDPIGIELFSSPVRMVRDFNQGKTLGEDCDAMAMLTVALCRSVGIPSNVVLLDTGGQGLDHAIAQVKINNTEIMIDPSSNLPLGWQESSYSKIVIS